MRRGSSGMKNRHNSNDINLVCYVLGATWGRALSGMSSDALEWTPLALAHALGGLRAQRAHGAPKEAIRVLGSALGCTALRAVVDARDHPKQRNRVSGGARVRVIHLRPP